MTLPVSRLICGEAAGPQLSTLSREAADSSHLCVKWIKNEETHEKQI
jgi:hypothetical protein